MKRYTDFSELTTPMLNEFVEKVTVHEGTGRGKERHQRIDIYMNFIGDFEVPAGITTPAEIEEQENRRKEEAEKEARSKELARERYEKRKRESREFTARKKAGLLTPEEEKTDEERCARRRAWQKEWREKKKASEPEKSKKKSIRELIRCQHEGVMLTDEETERLAGYRKRKAEEGKRCRERKKAKETGESKGGDAKTAQVRK